MVLDATTTTVLEKPTEQPAESKGLKEGDYAFHEPDDKTLQPAQHFSSLLLSGDWVATGMELGLLSAMVLAAVCLPRETIDVRGSMPFWHLAAFFWVTSIFTRLYNTYLEACWFSFPQYRTQPARQHALQKVKDICGRDLEQLKALVTHDRLTLLSQFVFGVAIYFAFPGYYPDPSAKVDGAFTRLVKLALNHLVLSFGMYWGHRAYHNNPFLWKYLHSVHHWARHPLSRNTYEDHWMENLINHIVGHFAAQFFVPLDHGLFWFSHLFRIMESLEKHSGISCYLNLAHQTQKWLPYAQMPHHHDWHHEGHKSCNFGFSSIGGFWDGVFDTRKIGRAEAAPSQMTAYDRKLAASKRSPQKSIIDEPTLVLLPSACFAAALAWKLHSGAPLVPGL